MTTTHRYTPRDIRTPPTTTLRLTERDWMALDSVYRYRAMTFPQLQQLVFPGVHRSVPQRRLARLFHHGLLDRHVLLTRGGVMTSPLVYLLARKGTEALSRHRREVIKWTNNLNTVGRLFLEHTLAISEFRVQVTQACENYGTRLIEWRGERELKTAYDHVIVPAGGGGTQRLSVIPDGFFVVKTPTGEATFCLEMDMGTMALKRYKLKVRAYLAYLKSKAFTDRFGRKGARVLTIAPSFTRLMHLKHTAEAVGGRNRFWFATLDTLTSESVLTEPVWWVAGREAKTTLLTSP